jgi:dTDP-4-dehydrorhamnose reductase
MVKTVLKLADRPELAFVDDQRGCPTFTADLAVALRRLAASRLAGTFHITNQGAVSWYEFVGDILELSGHDRTKVRPIKTADLTPPRPAPRPANSVLDNTALRLSNLPLLPPYQDPLAKLLTHLT